MPTIIPNGGAGDITSSEVTAYRGATIGTAGEQTSQEQQLAAAVTEKLAVISAGWTDAGGSGGKQRAVATEVLTRAAVLQGDLADTVRQWARPGRERAMMEMFGVLTKAVVERDRLLLELRERLNASPY